MKRYGGLWNKIATIENARQAILNASRHKKDRHEVKYILNHLDEKAAQLACILKFHRGMYRVGEYEFCTIIDGGKERELAKLPFYPDRCLQWAIMNVMESYFMKIFMKHSCASIKKGGIRRVIELTTRYLRHRPKYCLKLDIRKFYPSIDHEVMKRIVRWKFKDPDILDIFDKIIDSYQQRGLPIGSYLSQFLANLYLTPFDHFCKDDLKLRHVVRYMDDVIILHDDPGFLHDVRMNLDWFSSVYLHLHVKDNWQVFPIERRAIDFGGYCFSYDQIRVRKSTKIRMRKKLSKDLPFNDKNRSCVASYDGILMNCTYDDLRKKYIFPIKERWRKRND